MSHLLDPRGRGGGQGPWIFEFPIVYSPSPIDAFLNLVKMLKIPDRWTTNHKRRRTETDSSRSLKWLRWLKKLSWYHTIYLFFKQVHLKQKKSFYKWINNYKFLKKNCTTWIWYIWLQNITICYLDKHT